MLPRAPTPAVCVYPRAKTESTAILERSNDPVPAPRPELQPAPTV